jgi:hypothetical protein
MRVRLDTLLVGTGILVLVAGCVAPASSPTVSPPSVSPPASPPDSASVLPSDRPATSAPSLSSEPEPTPGNRDIDPSTFLQLCALPPDGTDGVAIECDWLVQTTLRGLPAADPVTRIETAYTCSTSCTPFDPDRGYAIVVTGAGALEVEVARQGDGSIAIAATTPVDPPDLPAFEAPPASAPAADGAPNAVNEREPLPLCGVETGSAYDPFDVEGRQCFWDGVRGGSPVEFITVHPDTEGRLTTTIYRYDGTGGVAVIHNDEGGWWRTDSGVAPAREEGRIFGLDGLTDRQPIPAD